VKTSSKLTVSLLTTLVVGGSSAGSLFSTVLNEQSSSSLGTAGNLFSTLNLPETTNLTAVPVAPTNNDPNTFVAYAQPTQAPSKEVVDPALQIRTMNQVPDEVDKPNVLPIPIDEPAPEVLPTPQPESSPSETPTPEPTESLPMEEPNSTDSN